jgi:hypothetical protein
MGEARRNMPYCVIGGCLLAATVALGIWRLAFIQHAKSAEGIVNPSSIGGTHVKIEFVTASGKKAWFTTGGEVATHPGQRVPVLYREGLDPRWYPDRSGRLHGSPGLALVPAIEAVPPRWGFFPGRHVGLEPRSHGGSVAARVAQA